MVRLTRIMTALPCIGLSLVVLACGTDAGASGAPVSASPTPRAAGSYEEYAARTCAAFEALFRAIGNPDTGSQSELTKAFEAAVDRHDGATARDIAAKIVAELEGGRAELAAARGWAPAANVVGSEDRLFLAFEAVIAAKLKVAQGIPGVDPQAAFESAGGLAAWEGMLRADPAIAAERPAHAKQCANVPLTP